MTRSDVLLCAVFLWGGLSSIWAGVVHVDQAQGNILYGAGDSPPSLVVKDGQDLGPGTFSAGENGILFLSTFPGSSLRLGESGTLRFKGSEMPDPTGPGRHQSWFRLQQGKLTIAIRPTGNVPHGYHVDVERGGLGMDTGLCVLCMHGDGSYIYVARGRAFLSGATMATGFQPMALTANGSVGMLEKNGTVRIRPLSAVASATQNCLLSGFKPDSAGGGAGSGPHVDSSGPIVSPIQ